MIRILKNLNPLISTIGKHQYGKRFFCKINIEGGPSNNSTTSGDKPKYVDMFANSFDSKPDKLPGPELSALSSEVFSKSLLMMRKSCTLSSIHLGAVMKSEEDTPIYGSMVPYALQVRETDPTIDTTLKDHGAQFLSPIMALKRSDRHVEHIKRYNKVSMVVYPLTPSEYPPSEFDLPRINVSGRIVKCVGEDSKLAESYYMLRYPNLYKVVNDPTYGYDFYKMTITDVYYYERDKKLKSIPINKFIETKPDQVSVESRDLIEIVNDNYRQSLAKIIQEHGDTEIDHSDVFMYFLDSHGFNCIGRRRNEDEWVDVRVPFDVPFDNISDCKASLIQTLNNAIKGDI